MCLLGCVSVRWTLNTHTPFGLSGHVGCVRANARDVTSIYIIGDQCDRVYISQVRGAENSSPSSPVSVTLRPYVRGSGSLPPSGSATDAPAALCPVCSGCHVAIAPRDAGVMLASGRGRPACLRAVRNMQVPGAPRGELRCQSAVSERPVDSGFCSAKADDAVHAI